MDRNALEERNIGENLEVLMNLDPRGYGVCRILQEGCKKAMGSPAAMKAAHELCRVIKKDDYVFLLTGFVLLPHEVPEMDGMVSTMLLARALVTAFDAKPVIICPEDCLPAVKGCAPVVGLHLYEDPKLLKERPMSMGVRAFTKDTHVAQGQAEALWEEMHPSAVISIEAPGANEQGVYHNATGLNITRLEAKTDILFAYLQSKGVCNVAIGDLGNEIGMGTIGEHIKKYIPYTAEGECRCGCKGGILAATSADCIITATCSDWGCYGLMAALAYLKQDMEILHDEDMEAEVMKTASRHGLIDMTGSLIPGIDGFDVHLNVGVLSLMRQCTAYALRYSHNSDHWFEGVVKKGFFE